MSGWAKQGEPHRRPQQGRALRGVVFGDMPVSNPPRRPRPKIKGLARPESELDEDHQPGGGVWVDITPGD